MYSKTTRQYLEAPNGAATGTTPAAAGVAEVTTGRESITPKPTTAEKDVVRKPLAKHERSKKSASRKDPKGKTAETKANPPALTPKTTTNVVVSKSNFNQTIIIPPAIDALFGMTPQERIAEVKRVCESDEVEALNTFVAPITHWMNDLDYVLDNYGDVVDALEEHFNRPGRPAAKRAKWADLSFDPETLKYIYEKFGYKSDMPISWAGICHVFFNRSIRTMQRRKAFQAMLTSGETALPRKSKLGHSSVGNHSGSKNSNIDAAEYTDVKNVAALAVKWASESPESSYAQAIMKLAADRAKRLGDSAPSFVIKSDAKRVITTPKALFDFLNTEYIDVLDEVFNPESEPEEFAKKLDAFASEIARAFHGDAIHIEIKVKKKQGSGR